MKRSLPRQARPREGLGHNLNVTNRVDRMKNPFVGRVGCIVDSQGRDR